MSFIYIVLLSFAAGLLGGMGMGGGTILIPALTIFLGVEQHVAQAANLAAFIPMAVISLKIHSSNGFVRTGGVLAAILPAVAVSVLGALFAAWLPSEVLRRLFGAFLLSLAANQALAIFRGAKNKKSD